MSLADCPSNLKEAIDWILRVTGKDGQGSDNTRDLAKAVKRLLEGALQEVETLTSKSDGNSAELSQLKEHLTKAVKWVGKDLADDTMFEYSGTPGPIGMLSSALARFIGYGSTGVIFDPPTAGKITGAGIAPSNIATHRLCDATIAFTIGVLEGCRKYSAINVNGNLNKVNTLITKLREKYGKGTTGLQGVAQEVESQLANNGGRGTWPGLDAFVNDFRNAFTTNINGLTGSAENVAVKIGDYLKGVFQNWSTDNGNNIEGKFTALGSRLTQNAYNPSSVTKQINDVSGALKPKSGTVHSALSSGMKAFISQLKKRNYSATNYKEASKIKWKDSNDAGVKTCAKIFLGCLPFIFNNLSYFYWQCRDGGAWRNHNLTGGALSAFMQGHWFFNSYMNENMTGTSVVRNVMNTRFPELQTASSGKHSYSDFLKKFKSTGIETWKQDQQTVSNTNYLSGVYMLCTCYFQCQQIKNSDKASRSPNTIREMLYFLGALQFSPQYDAFDGYVTEYFKGLQPDLKNKNDDSELKLQVADSGSSKPSNTLSAADLKSHLLSTAIFIPGALGVMQGPGASEKSEPWLYELFCNSAFSFKYPTGASLFSLISNYAYALQFQVLFLHLMCSTYVDKCGWNNCTYGKEVKPNGSGETLASHICPGLKCEISRCQHNGKSGNNQCNHNNYSGHKSGDITQFKWCGYGTDSSLQAFLTDGIQGMCRRHPGTSYHLATCSGSLCHVPMGFKAKHLRQNAGMGNHILTVLNRFCGGSDTPLRQLCEKLGCLTKRTPRSLGDLFGFMWHLNGQLFPKSNQGNITSARWFSDLKVQLPFSHQLKNESGQKLLALVGTGHTNGHETADLTSLTNSNCSQQQQACGPYLYPFTVSNGATFGKPAPYATAYLSWMVYLTEDFHEWFQNLLDEFKNIDCSKTGCVMCKDKDHKPGTHGTTSDQCKCDSVVHCGGVLPLLYRYGFTFGSVNQLSGNNKRTCDKLATQLQNVIKGEPLNKLITTIDDFLYMFRIYFFYNQSTFWTIYVCIILYTFFFLLDTLRVRSHLKLASSHTVPPLALLATGKAPALTKLTYYLP
ncbi:variant erythrocyte surface antigen-1 family protein [Babesia caballi]|uniref:Variant erythrocyte surface antigen-1 family protein n=1 Tax=Babesia caballi TaxID=5871 RepID=A0AAV4LU95_BABCB|nr:variant erythrocyte surface antigen-1 family protein [Babesia caballi]